MGRRNPFAAHGDGLALAQAIVDTVREPLLVMDKDLPEIPSEAAGHAGSYALRIGRWPVGHSGIADAA